MKKNLKLHEKTMSKKKKKKISQINIKFKNCTFCYNKMDT